MGVYSIKDLEKISGIKAHTIRIWERRYGVIEPQRSDTNIRKYSDTDLKRIINISILNQNGLKISKIACLSSEDLKQKVLDICTDVDNSNVQIESMVVSMLELNESKFNEVLNNNISNIGFEAVVESILFPFLDRIGVLWQTGTITPAQEHFISNLVRQKLIVAIDKHMDTPKNDKRITFFLPENELHEIGLLFYSLIARIDGYNVVYLGVSVPFEDIKQVNEIQEADVFFTSLVNAPTKKEINKILLRYTESFPDTLLIVTGHQVKMHKNEIPDSIQVISSSNEFRECLSNL